MRTNIFACSSSRHLVLKCFQLGNALEMRAKKCFRLLLAKCSIAPLQIRRDFLWKGHFVLNHVKQPFGAGDYSTLKWWLGLKGSFTCVTQYRSALQTPYSQNYFTSVSLEQHYATIIVDRLMCFLYVPVIWFSQLLKKRWQSLI